MSELGTHNGDGIRYRMSLSAPKGGVAQMLRDPAGDWVPYSEYLEYLEKVGYPFWKKEAYEHKAENERLKAEIERLYRHGDLMLKFAAANMSYPAYATMAKDWLDVKKGRPSV